MIYDSTLWTGAGTKPLWPRIVNYIGSKAAKVLCWALTYEMVRSGRVRDRERAKYLVEREIREMSETVAYQHSEIEMLTSRLSRRYDPGQALNEAARRAVADKQEQRMSPQQKAALEFQKQYLAKIVRKA
jgi:hypothetical protein